LIARTRVLIVDDQPELRLLLMLTLGGGNLELSEATSGTEALAACAASPPDIVLLDVMMPGMDGYEVCRRIKADPRLAATTVVLMTAADQATQRRKGMEAGTDHYVSKPFSPERLQQLINDIIASRQA
jgi:CheY-like chemotaxis protein